MSSRPGRSLRVWLSALLVTAGLLGGHTLLASAASGPTSSAPEPSPSAAPPAPTPSVSCEGSVPERLRCNITKALGAAKDAAGAAIAAQLGAPGAATGLATGAAGAVTGAVADAAEAAFTHWLAQGASWVLGQIAGSVTAVTTPDLTAKWFTTHYQTMWQIGVLCMGLFLIAAVLQAVMRRDLGMLAGSVARVPAAFILAAGAVSVTSLGLLAIDQLTAVMTSTIGKDMPGFLTNVGAAVLASTGDPVAAPVFLALGSLLAIVAGILVYVELLLREIVIYVALLFLPLALAAIVWPAARRWAVGLAETIAAAALSKFIIAGVMSLAVAAASGHGGGKGASYPAVILGAVLLGMAAYAPYKFLRMMPRWETAAVHAVRGRGGAGVVERGQQTAQSFHRQMRSASSARVRDIYARQQARGAMAGAGGAGAAAGGVAAAATLASRVGRSAGASHDAMTGGSGGRKPPPPPPAAPAAGAKPQPKPRRPGGGHA